MKRVVWLLLFLPFVLSGQILTDNDQLNCYTIVVGKKVSATGYVIVAHNEDDWGNRIVNIHRVPRLQHKDSLFTLVNGKKIPQKKFTFGYLWFETTQENFGDMLINDNGVVICSNACPSKEDTAKGWLTYDFRHLIAQRAINAGHGVMIAGELIEKYGYGSSGRTYCIADSNEAWLLAVVKGRHWIAQRVPDTAVAIVPNYYTITKVNLADKQNFMGSKDIIDYAIKRGWFDTTGGKEFNFRLAYSAPYALYSIGNIPRHWSGVNQLSFKEYRFRSPLPFAFKPKKQKVGIEDLMAVLSSHYEGTDFEAHKNLRPNPHYNYIHRICNQATKFSAVVQFNSDPKKTIIWWAPLNPCIHPYVPIVLGIPKIPDNYHNRPWTEARKMHFDKQSNVYEANPTLAFTIFHKYNEKLNSDYWKLEKQAHKLKSKIETLGKEKVQNAKTLDQLIKVSQQMLQLLYEEEAKQIE